MRYLLDTNIISDVIDQPTGLAAARIRQEVRRAAIVTSILVVSELRYGYTKISSKRLKAAYEIFFENIAIESWETPFDYVYADMRSALEEKGRPIGAMDMLIAAHALATDATVVTANVRHFSQVPNLKIENWKN
ncbi:type II toxin-antitoxin system VapC family toxin [Mesorhizobium sp. LHD-90]|uniref:type II toxin-antitoxin system VapC family toxin n=1 Tax=Mesorhizobium sp. LHD-90 TaxID=3071414 RepID=UPI0027E0E7D1|nr:type II toxin-antitoxin system VapC family toxin [Mesorhizobium sp. LHD-90]MDQ6433655.1 type II toxin-antitoxin system VapC family toxin [Mesorhizobium sp. LHD-90]